MTSQAPRSEKPDPRKNYFLGRLQAEDYDAFLRASKVAQLKLGERLRLQDKPVDAVYFPLTCMFSVLTTNVGEPRLELATIGKEGVVGAAEVFQRRGRPGSAMGILHDSVQLANWQQWLYAMALAVPLRLCPLGRMSHVPHALVPQRISCLNLLDSRCDAFLPAWRACSSRTRSGRLHHPEAVERLGIHNLRCESRPAGHGVAPVAKLFFAEM
jgi:hypothetical protein